MKKIPGIIKSLVLLSTTAQLFLNEQTLNFVLCKLSSWVSFHRIHFTSARISFDTRERETHTIVDAEGSGGKILIFVKENFHFPSECPAIHSSFSVLWMCVSEWEGIFLHENESSEDESFLLARTCYESWQGWVRGIFLVKFHSRWGSLNF